MMLTVQQFAQRAKNYKTRTVGISPARVGQLIDAGIIRAERQYGRILIDPRELARWNRKPRPEGRPPNKTRRQQ